MSNNFKYTREMERDPQQDTRIACEYCGGLIDTATDSHCRSCGGTYMHNSQYRQLRKTNLEDKKLEMEDKKLEMEEKRLEMAERQAAMKRNQQIQDSTAVFSKILRFGCLIPVILMVLFFTVIVVTGLFMYIRGDLNDNPVQPIPSTEAPIVETPTEVGFKESAEMIQYSVICDKMEEYDYPWREPKNGFYYVKLHLIVTNKSDEKWLVPAEMLCQYEKDGYLLQAIVNTIRSDDLDTKIYNTAVFPGSSAEGWVYFEVPLDTDLILRYDENVTIRIDAQNCDMLED